MHIFTLFIQQDVRNGRLLLLLFAMNGSVPTALLLEDGPDLGANRQQMSISKSGRNNRQANRKPILSLKSRDINDRRMQYLLGQKPHG